MNTIWRFVINLSQAKGVKKFMLLLVSAFLFAVPFMTKSLLSDSGNGIGFFAFLGWTALSLPLLTVFDFKKSLKRVFSSLFCFFFMLADLIFFFILIFYVFVFMFWQLWQQKSPLNCIILSLFCMVFPFCGCCFNIFVCIILA